MPRILTHGPISVPRAMGPVVVTGAAGFVGAAIVDALVRQGASVAALVHPRTDAWRLAPVEAQIDLARLDLNDVPMLATVLRRHGPKVVIHAAARGGHPVDRVSREAGWRDTVHATIALWECLEGLDVERVVHIASSQECAPSDRPVPEDVPLGPVSARGVHKVAALLTARQRSEELGLPAVFVRVFSAYGQREQEHRLVPTLLRCLRSGAPFRLTRDVARRDFVHIDDVAEACVLAAGHPSAVGETLNVGTGVETSNDELVALARDVTGRPLVLDERPFEPRPGDRAHSVADVTKTARLLGWRATTALADGLARTYALAEPTVVG